MYCFCILEHFLVGGKVAKLSPTAMRWLKPLSQGHFRKIFELLSKKWDFDQLDTYIKLYHLNYPKLVSLKPLQLRCQILYQII